MGWVIEYWDGTNWVKLKATLDKIVQELDGHEEASFKIANTAANRNIVAQDRDVRISFNNAVIFKGLLTGATYSKNLITCICYEKCQKIMAERDFSGEYSSADPSIILSDIATAAGVVAGACPTTPLVSVRFRRTICLDAAKFLADVLNLEIYFDRDAADNPRVNIGTPGVAQGAITPISWPDRGIDRAKVRDRVIVRGIDEEGNEIEGSAGTGTRVAVFTEKKATDVNTLNNIAAKKLSELNRETTSVKLPIKLNVGFDFSCGDTVTLNNAELNLVGDFRIWKVVKKITIVEITVDKAEKTIERALLDTKHYEDYGIYPMPVTMTRIGAGNTFPAEPETGQLFYRSDENILYRYDGTAWRPVVQVSGEGTVFPASPQIGDIFFRTDENILYRYDGTSWKPIHHLSGHGTTFPTSPREGDFFYLTTDNWLYRFDGTNWVRVSHQQYGSTFPTTPEVGDTFYHTAYEQTFYFDGTNWVPLATICRSGTEFPANKVTGDIFFRSDKLKFYRWDGSRWVQVAEDLASAKDNLVLNHGAEIDRDEDGIPDYWAYKDGAYTFTLDSYEGEKCFALDIGASGTYPSIITCEEGPDWPNPVPYIDVEPGKSYLIRLRARNLDAIATGFNIRIHKRGRDKTTDLGYDDHWQSTKADLNWDEYVVLWKAPSDTYWIMIEVYKIGGENTTIIIDSVWMLRQISWDQIFDEEYTVSTYSRRWEGESDSISKAAGTEIVDEAAASGGKCIRRTYTQPSNTMWAGPYRKIGSGEFYALFNLKVGNIQAGQENANLISIDVCVEYGTIVLAARTLTPNEIGTTWKTFALRFRCQENWDTLEIRGMAFQSGVADLYMDWVGVVSADVPLEATGVSILDDYAIDSVSTAPAASVVAAAFADWGDPVAVPAGSWTPLQSITVPNVDHDLLFVCLGVSRSEFNAPIFGFVKLIDETENKPYPDINLTIAGAGVGSDVLPHAFQYLIIFKNIKNHVLTLYFYTTYADNYAGYIAVHGRSPHVHDHIEFSPAHGQVGIRDPKHVH